VVLDLVVQFTGAVDQTAAAHVTADEHLSVRQAALVVRGEERSRLWLAAKQPG
jgi:hypothetical protein